MATAAVADLDVDVAYRDVGQGREQDAEALNTRFRRCAQVIAMDGRYAGFAGAKTGHRGMLLYRRKRVIFDHIGSKLSLNV